MSARFLRLSAAALLGACALLAGPASAAPAPPQGLDLQIALEQGERIGPGGIPYEEALKRALIYTAGSQRVNEAVVEALLADEVARRKAAGDDLAHTEIVAADLDAQVLTMKADFEAKNPEIDFWTVVGSMGHDETSYREEMRRMLLVDRLFFPQDPDKWPIELLKEIFAPTEPAAPAAEGEAAFPVMSVYEQTVQPTLDALRAAHEKGEELELGGFLMQYVLRPGVMQWLLGKAEVTEPFRGLPAGLALRVNGHDFTTDELLGRAARMVGPVELERAKMLVDVIWKVEAALEEKGALLAPEQALERIALEREEYRQSPISYEQMMLQFLGFPSMEVFHHYYLLRQSYRDVLGDPTPEQLAAHADARRQFLAQGKIDAEVIYFAARDMTTGLYPRTGDPFGDAEKRARRAGAELAAGADWDATLVANCDLPDKYPGSQPGMPVPNRGRFGALPRNQVRDFLGENDYLEFLYGASIADRIFFDAQPGTIYGPVMGPTGWAIYKVNQRLDPESEFDPANNERHNYLVNDDYLNVKFFAFVDEVMAF